MSKGGNRDARDFLEDRERINKVNKVCGRLTVMTVNINKTMQIFFI